MAFFEYGKREIQYLTEKNKALGEAIEKIGYVERKANPDLLGALVSSTVDQQIPTRAGQTIWKRMYDGLSEVAPETIGKCPAEELQVFGISFRKVEYIKNAARKALDRELNLEALHTTSDEGVCQELSSLKGVGAWTAEMLMTFSMQRPDVLSLGNLTIRRGLRMLYHRRKIDKKPFEKYRRRYSPYGTMASLYLWTIAGGTTEGMRDYAPKERQGNRHMKIIISPAKKMRVDTGSMETVGVPVYVKGTGRLLEVLREYSLGELQKLFAANEDTIRLNYEYYQNTNLEERLTPAVLFYVGIQYQSMAPGVFTSEQWEYVDRRLHILSGFYGILNACDGVTPYRLEMRTKLLVDGCRDLYGFWGGHLYREPVKEDQVIINLVSKEYSKAMEPHIEKDVTFLTCVFAEEQVEKLKVRATATRIAHSIMVHWLAERQIQDMEKVKGFDEGGYRYCGEMSGEREWVFLKNNDSL